MERRNLPTFESYTESSAPATLFPLRGRRQAHLSSIIPLTGPANGSCGANKLGNSGAAKKDGLRARARRQRKFHPSVQGKESAYRMCRDPRMILFNPRSLPR